MKHVDDKTRRQLKDRSVSDEDDIYDDEYDEDDDEEDDAEEDEVDDEGHDEAENERREEGGVKGHEEEDEERGKTGDEAHGGERDREHEVEVSAHERPDTNAHKTPPSCLVVHSVNNYTTYQQIKKEQKEISDERKILTHLCNAFKTMPNIKRVVFMQSWRKPDQCWCEQVATDATRRSHKPWPMLPPCTAEVCSIVEAHRPICVEPWTTYEKPEESIEWWSDLMFALEKSNKVLPELVMETPRANYEPDRVSLSTDVFKLSRRLDEINPKVLSKLTRLELSLELYPEKVNRVLSDAKALETLHISIATFQWEELTESFGRPDFWDQLFSISYSLHGCIFPNLHTLSMDRFTATEEEILEFVRRSPSLRRLVLRRCRLHKYWVPLVRSLRDESNL